MKSHKELKKCNWTDICISLSKGVYIPCKNTLRDLINHFAVTWLKWVIFLTILLIWHWCYNHVTWYKFSPVFSASSRQCCIYMKHVSFILLSWRLPYCRYLKIYFSSLKSPWISKCQNWWNPGTSNVVCCIVQCVHNRFI